jgi:hypothetical protein
MMKRVTYSQLAKALATLGFEKIEHHDFTLFQNTEYDAMIVLPKGIGTTVVSPAHLLATKVTVIGKAAADASSFDDMVNTVTAKPRTRKVNKSISVVKSP